MNLIVSDVSIQQDDEGRYCLNDLHKAAGGERKHGPSLWLENQQTKELAQELSDTGIPVSVIKGGIHQGTYVCKELVYAYAMWISPSFHLKVIRTFDQVATQRQPALPADRFSKELIFAEYAARILNMSDSGRLLTLKKIEAAHGLTPMLPEYAIDDGGNGSGSSRETKSASELLKAHGSPMSAVRFNELLISMGMLEIRTRKSRSKDGVKQFKGITTAGLQYGKNATHPSSPNETQPLWFVDSFDALHDLVMGNGDE